MQKDERKIDSNEFLIKVMKSEPGFTVSDHFVDRVTARVSRKMIWKQYVKEFLIYLAVIAGIAVSLVAMAFIWYGAVWNEWLNYLLNNSILILGIGFMIVFVLFIDKTLLPYFLSRPHEEID